MQKIKEYILNGMLTTLVILSIVLSYQVWFPSDQGGLGPAKEAHVQSSPPSQSGDDAPDIHRPERIYLRNKDGQTALLPADSPEYLRVWKGLGGILGGLQPISGQAPEDEVDRNGEAITLILPVPLTLGQWADIWKWRSIPLPNVSLKVDRMTIYLDKAPTVYFSGATGTVFRIGPLPQTDQMLLRELLTGTDTALFSKYRPLVFKDPSVKVASGVAVPDVTEMPEGTLDVKKPDRTVEQARYFPDLSVVRHIEEKDANSYTDGQRWLRITLAGQMEFVTAPPPGASPDLGRAIDAAKRWVLTHEGWSQDFVLSEYVQQPNRSLLVYDRRLAGGRFPVETAQGAMQVEMTLRDQVLTVMQYRRYPDFVPKFTRGRISVMPPEKALQNTAAQFLSLFLFEGEVREMHLAYLIWLPDGLITWKLEPVWVIQVGEKQVYTPASPLSTMKPVVVGM